jgi:hypothetical protein
MVEHDYGVPGGQWNVVSAVSAASRMQGSPLLDAQFF